MLTFGALGRARSCGVNLLRLGLGVLLVGVVV